MEAVNLSGSDVLQVQRLDDFYFEFLCEISMTVNADSSAEFNPGGFHADSMSRQKSVNAAQSILSGRAGGAGRTSGF
jgi:hypothetical protein